MVQLHSVQHFQWDDFHGTQFSTIPWKWSSHDLMWKIKTSRFPSSCNRESNAYLWQQFSVKAIYLLFLGTFSSELFVVVRLHYCKQQQNYAVPYHPKELGQALVTVSPLSDTSGETGLTGAYLKVKLFPLSGVELNWLLMYFLHFIVGVSFNFKINFLSALLFDRGCLNFLFAFYILDISDREEQRTE